MNIIEFFLLIQYSNTQELFTLGNNQEEIIVRKKVNQTYFGFQNSKSQMKIRVLKLLKKNDLLKHEHRKFSLNKTQDRMDGETQKALPP